MTILAEILEKKRSEVNEARSRVSMAEMRARAEAVTESPRGFYSALVNARAPAVIAEIKRRSPSRGLIREDFDPVHLAQAYARGGAAALSVLTDESFFGGDLAYLRQVREATTLPILRKDFIVDGYQLDEARVAGADAVLLIVAALDSSELAELHGRGLELGLDVLVEVHNEEELERALACGTRFVGVNNRDLATFDVDLAVTERLAAALPQSQDRLLVAESGIHHNGDIERLQRAGAGAFLVGESLMRQADVALALDELRRTQ
jgi:indole-3-glycerol phosphate synthase